MSYIEGIGDEVTLLFLVFFFVLLLSVLWISTSVSERPLIRVVVLDRSRLQEFIRRFTTRHRPAVTAAAATDTPREDSAPPANQQQQPQQQEPNALFDKPAENSTETSDESIPLLHQSVLDSFVSETLLQPGDNQSESRDNNTSSIGATENNTHTSTSNSQDAARPVDESNIEKNVIAETESKKDENTEKNLGKDETDKRTEDTHERTDETDKKAEETDKNTDDTNKSGISQETSRDETSATTTTPPVEEEIVQDGHIRVRLRYLDERQRMVHAKPEDTIGQFKRKHFSVELADNFAVRFIFRGQELREDQSTLRAYHIEDNSVIHCLMSRISQAETDAQSQHHHQQQHQHQQQLDLGFLMFPLFGLILGLIWYCRFTYRSYFSAVSTLSLIGITFLYLVALLASFRPGVHEHHD